MTERPFTLPLTAGGHIALAVDERGGISLTVEAEAPGGGTRDKAQALVSIDELRAFAGIAKAAAMHAETLAVAADIEVGCTLGQGGPMVCKIAHCPCSLALAGAS